MHRLKQLDGQLIPPIGFGTWQIIFHTKRKVLEAINLGYRLIDTAKVYGNEIGVGEAIAATTVPRDELYITTKLWNGDQGYDSALKAIDQSLERLGLDYIDLYLIHWPSDSPQQRVESWQALVEIQQSGKARSIGVSNYYPDQITEAVAATGVTPAVNQIEFHPFIYHEQIETVEFCREQGIIVEAYSPLAQGRQMDHPVITKIAMNHGKANAQVMLRWCIEQGTVPIPKTSHQERMQENFNVFDFTLTPAEITALQNLAR